MPFTKTERVYSKKENVTFLTPYTPLTLIDQQLYTKVKVAFDVVYLSVKSKSLSSTVEKLRILEELLHKRRIEGIIRTIQFLVNMLAQI